MCSVFDDSAAKWDSKPRRIKIAKDVTDAIKDRLSLTGTEKLLDFGTGTGLVLLAFNGFVKELYGADNSQGMLDVLKQKIEEAELEDTFVKRFDVDADDFENEFYDVITSSMVTHHLKDPVVFYKKAFAALKPGGRLCIADLVEEDGSFHDEVVGEIHHGFDTGWVAEKLMETGFIDVSVEIVTNIEKDRDGEVANFPIFLAIAEKED